MTDTAEFAGRCVGAASLLIASIGMSACATVRVDDMRFVGVRKVDARSVDVKAYGIGRDRILGTDLIQATVSTSFDFVALANGKDRWAPYVREWQCSKGWGDDFPQAYYEVYANGKRVRTRTANAAEDNIADLSVEKANWYEYTFFFPVRATAEHIDALSPNRSAYDLEKAPADVCVEFGTAGYGGSILLETNVVTIPADAFRDVFSDTRR